MTPGPNNILALSSATSHGFRQSTRVLAGMSLGFWFVMLLCAGISFSLAVIWPGSGTPFELGGGGIYCLAGVENRHQPNKGRRTSGKTNQLWASFALQFVNVKIILYGVTALSTFVLPQTQALSWVVGVSVLLAMIGTFGNVCWALAGHLFQRLFRQYGRQLNIVLALLLVYLRGTHFLLTKKKKRKRSPSSLSNLLLKPYRLSVKVRAITSRCCSGVRELKRTA